MGGSEPPYIYTPQRTVYPYSNFNPRAVTQAAQKTVEEEKKEKSKQNGPLINFNAHPDSYMIVGTQNVNYKTMPARTKKEVTIIRWVQFALRIIQELAAIGMLVCVICMSNVSIGMIWIMRLAPAWDILVTLYAVYHLVRPAKARTPASSASYHFFALFMDIGLIPFYCFIAIFSDDNYYYIETHVKDHWKSLFTEPGATQTVLLAMFIGAASIAGLHLLSSVFDLWLVILFRKISKLPPDMNPLEDNLTSRPHRTSKHKYKNSEVTLTDSMAEFKKPGYLSGSTLSVGETSRLSTASKEDVQFRGVPFQHSRMGSQTTFSPHNPETARWSRQQFDDVGLYAQQNSARGSKADVRRPTIPKRSSFIEEMDAPPVPARSTDCLNTMRPTSFPQGSSVTDFGSPSRYSSPALPNAAPSNALVKSQQRQALLNDNWTTCDDENALDTASPTRPRANIPNILVERHDSFEHQPLKMNPPTPPSNKYEFPDPDDEPLSVRKKRQALTDRLDNGNGDLGVQRQDTTGSSIYSESAPSLKSSKNGTPKGKYYGDLKTATMGVRSVTSNGTLNAAVMDSTGMGAVGEYGFSAPSPPPQKMKRTPRKMQDAGGRVVSRSGVDYTDAQAPYSSAGIRDRREVSGKVAEEGRGGGGWWRGSRH